MKSLKISLRKFEGAAIEKFRIINSQIKDVVVKFGQSKFRLFSNEKLHDVEFDRCQFENVKFQNCRFDQTVLRNVKVKDLTLKNLDLSGKVIESTEAFLKLVQLSEPKGHSPLFDPRSYPLVCRTNGQHRGLKPLFRK